MTSPALIKNLRAAIENGCASTVSYDTGIQVSGVLAELPCDAADNPIYLRTSGPTRLAFNGRDIPGHGTDYHAEGFGSPIGRVKHFSRCLSGYTDEELRTHGVIIGQRTQLEYVSGISVEGELQTVYRQAHRNLVLSFNDCTVTDLSGRLLFDPAWGTYDLAVGSKIISVTHADGTESHA